MWCRARLADLRHDERGGTTIALALITGLVGFSLYHSMSVENLKSAGAMAAYMASDSGCVLSKPANDAAAKGGRRFNFKVFSHDLIVTVKSPCSIT